MIGKEWMEIDLDFASFKGTRVPENTRSKWRIIATPHVRYRRNKSLNQGKGGQEPVNVNMELQDLLGKYGISYGAGNNLLTEILNQSDREFFTKLFSAISCLLSIRHNNGLKGADEKDFILSPVQNPTGEFFYSENATSEMPQNADANGAYHIAMKGKWVLDQLDKANPDELKTVKLAISNQEWLQYMQGKSDMN
jgi:CRISPR-associated protein Cpf1